MRPRRTGLLLLATSRCVRATLTSNHHAESGRRYVGLIDRRGKLLVVGFDDREAFSRVRQLKINPSPDEGVRTVSVSAADYRAWWEGLLPDQQALLILDGGSLPP